MRIFGETDSSLNISGLSMPCFLRCQDHFGIFRVETTQQRLAALMAPLMTEVSDRMQKQRQLCTKGHCNLVGALDHFLFFHIVGMSSSQLTFIFFRWVGQPPTS